MLNFYRKFLHKAAGVLAPLKGALKGSGKSLTWSLALDSTFQRAKDLLALVPELFHPRPDTSISLAVDASDSHIGSVLQQLLDGSSAPGPSSPRSYLMLSRITCHFFSL